MSTQMTIADMCTTSAAVKLKPEKNSGLNFFRLQFHTVYVTAMIIYAFISCSAVEICDLSYVHFMRK